MICSNGKSWKALRDPWEDALQTQFAEIWREVACVDLDSVVARTGSGLLGRGFELDRFAQPGFVGLGYRKGGLLLMGQNPGNGSSGFQSKEDELQERLLARLRAARTHDETVEAFGLLMQGLETMVMPTWRIVQNVVMPLLSRLQLSFKEIAYTNLMKFRTADRKIKTEEVRKSRQLTLTQIKALEPSVIVCLGIGAFNEFAKVFSGPEIVDRVERSIGDFRLPDAGWRDIERIAVKWSQKPNS